jgi:HlyD family secretion protein
MIHTGQIVSFKVDAFPKDSFTGRVSQVRLNATTVQNVVTYNTIIDFDNPDLKLFPGMTAYITLPVADAPNVLRVPNGALRYKPDMPADQLRALYKQYGLSSGQQAGAKTPGGQGSTAQGAAATGTGDTGAAAKQRRSQTEGGQGGGGGAGSGQQRTPRVDVAVVWKLRPDKTLEPIRIRTGITDHTLTEVAQVLNGQLNEDDELITGSIAASPGAARAPGMGGTQQRPR